jgi:uncharacterized membrane-anchored protein
MIRNTRAPWAAIAVTSIWALLAGPFACGSPRAARADSPPNETLPAEKPAADEAAPDEKPADEKPKLSPEQQRQVDLYNSIQWQSGPVSSALGTIATLQVPENFRLTTGPGAAAFLELTQNMPNPKLLGIMTPSDSVDWFLTFTYDDSGHVADDDREKLDAAAILDSYRQGDEASNAERKRRGWSQLHVTGWLQPPSYDAITKNLTWAIKADSEGNEVANYDLRLLSRQGVMRVGLVADPDQIPLLVPTVKHLVTGCEFTPGNKYGEFRAGDKMAEYGLIGLITGGAAIAAAKTGLLAKLGVMFAKFAKPIIVGAITVGAAIWKFIGRLFGAKSESSN